MKSMAKILIFVLVIALIIVARRPQSAVDKSGVSLLSQPQKTEQPDVLKVASYNIQTGKGLDGKRNLIASAQVMAAADLVGVQEVYAAGFDGFLGMNSGQTERLAKVGKFAWLALCVATVLCGRGRHAPRVCRAPSRMPAARSPPADASNT